MIGYVTLGTNDLGRAAAFYDGLAKAMNATRLMETDRFIGWGRGTDQPLLMVFIPYDEQPATVGNGVMVALQAENPAEVDRLFARVMELGATSDGDPGARGGGFYGAYFRDLDGNKLNFFCFTAAE